MQLGSQVVKQGDALFVLPVVPDDAPALLKSAVAIRNEATLRGRCGCGATLTGTEHGGGMLHAPRCPASDAAIAAMLREAES